MPCSEILSRMGSTSWEMNSSEPTSGWAGFSVGQTLACGSGACAALVAAVLTGKAEREATVHLLGGDLHIRWDEESDRVFMTGPAEFVFEGEWPGFE